MTVTVALSQATRNLQGSTWLNNVPIVAVPCDDTADATARLDLHTKGNVRVVLAEFLTCHDLRITLAKMLPPNFDNFCVHSFSSF